jgi:hypothetical protein
LNLRIQRRPIVEQIQLEGGQNEENMNIKTPYSNYSAASIDRKIKNFISKKMFSSAPKIKKSEQIAQNSSL